LWQQLSETGDLASVTGQHDFVLGTGGGRYSVTFSTVNILLLFHLALNSVYVRAIVNFTERSL
jgi:hypothetical protein